MQKVQIIQTNNVKISPSLQWCHESSTFQSLNNECFTNSKTQIKKILSFCRFTVNKMRYVASL